jgi:azurin
MMAAQPVDRLRSERALLTVWFDQPDVPAPVLRGAFAALLADGASSLTAWQFAEARSGSLIELFRAVAALPRDRLAAVASALVSRVEAVVAAAGTESATRSAGVAALARLRPDQATIATLAVVLRSSPAADLRAATIAALLEMPDAAWNAAPIDELAANIVSSLAAMPTAERTEAAGLAAIALGERLATRLPVDRARTVRRDLRGLAVRVVRIETLPEQVSFDLRWFAVEAGKPVRIVLVNPDAMPHNVVIGRPGSLKAIGTAGNAMSMPSDPSARPFVPDLPQVLFATRLVTQGQTESLGFVAPVDPGEYVFVCTFPGHWVRMYGVMLVVPDLDAFEAAPTPPSDPMTRQPYASPRNP